jgi:hypothetical protein
MKEGKLAVSAEDQRHLYAKTSITDITAEAENDRRLAGNSLRLMG